MIGIDPLRAIGSGFFGVWHSNEAGRFNSNVVAGIGPTLSLLEREVLTWFEKNIDVVAWRPGGENQRQSPHLHMEMPRMGSRAGLVFGEPCGWTNAGETRLRSSAILQRYSVGGDCVFLSLAGAWVTVIADDESDQLMIKSDPEGRNRAYVRKIGRGSVAFSSNSSLLAAMGTIQVNRPAIAEFLRFLYVPSPRTVYVGVDAIIPGKAIVCDSAGVQQRGVSWRLFARNDQSRACNAHPGVAMQAKEFGQLLAAAVERNMPPDREVTLLLSAGKDSTSLAAALAEVGPRRVVSLTVSTGDSWDEFPLAKAVSKHFGFEHRVVRPSIEEILKCLPQLLRVQDQPCADPAGIALFAALKKTAALPSVIFDGTGNDAYFGIVKRSGYYRYALRRKIEPAFPKMAWRGITHLLSKLGARGQAIAKTWSRPIEETFVSWEGWQRQDLNFLVGVDLSLEDSYLWELMRDEGCEDWIAAQTNAICAVWEPHAAFRKTVDAALASGMSARFPFADPVLRDFVGALPDPFRFHGQMNKVLLRQYLKDHVPEPLLAAGKGSFVLSTRRLLEYSGRGWLRSFCSKDDVLDLLGIDKNFLLKTVTEFNSGQPDLADRLYALGFLVDWYSLHLREIDDSVR